MVNWQVTATTILCEAVADEVTIMVYKDGTAKCTGHKKYTQPTRETGKLVKEKSRELKRPPKCEGPQCPRVTGYRDKLFAEDAAQPRSAQ